MEQNLNTETLLDIVIDVDVQIHDMIHRLEQYEDCEYTAQALEALRVAHRRIRRLKYASMPGD